MTTDERIEARRAELMTQRAERKDELDLPRTMTMRQVRDYLAETAALDRKIAAFNTAVEAWAALPSLEPDTRWRDFLQSSRATLNAELLAIRAPIRDDVTRERARDLGWSIEMIDHGLGISRTMPIVTLAPTRLGELMQQAGYVVSGPELRGARGFLGSLLEVEQRIKEITRQRAAAEAALASVLMTDDERATQDAAAKALNDAFNAMHVKGSSDGLGYVVVDEDGAARDLDTLTSIERQAFERFDAAERQRRQDTLDRQMGRR